MLKILMEAVDGGIRVRADVPAHRDIAVTGAMILVTRNVSIIFMAMDGGQVTAGYTHISVYSGTI